MGRIEGEHYISGILIYNKVDLSVHLEDSAAWGTQEDFF